MLIITYKMNNNVSKCVITQPHSYHLHIGVTERLGDLRNILLGGLFKLKISQIKTIRIPINKEEMKQ